MTVSLRPATIEDMDLVYHWRNRTDISSVGSAQRAVGWSEHHEWFTGCIVNSTQAMYIIQKDNTPVGQLRFDQRTGNTTAVSIYLLPEHQVVGNRVVSIET